MNKNEELRIVKNFISCMPKTYRKRTMNFVIIRDILLTGSKTMGRNSSIDKCIELGIDPYGYKIEEVQTWKK